MKQVHYLTILVVLINLFSGCRKNEKILPAPPDTRIFVDKINLGGDHRLGTSVEMHWTGYSSSGYITGYDVSLDNISWKTTKTTDSTFLFTLTKGKDSSDIFLYVRAIDNYGQKDPTPAKLRIPIKNSPPNIAFSKVKTLPDTVNTIFSIEWAAYDPDGDSTIDSVYIKFNNGAWYPLTPSISFASFIPENVTGSGMMNAMVYKNTVPVLLNNKIDGIILGGVNKLYIRAKDNAGSYSLIDSSGSFFLKNKSSDFLVINANSAIDPANDPLRGIAAAVYGKYDFINFITGNQKYQPLYWSPTFNFLLKLYDKVFIYSDGLRTNGKMVLEYAAPAISDFLNNGGKILVSTPIPADIDPASLLFNFSPADSISGSGGQARFYQDSLAVADPVNAIGYPNLECSSFILGFEPFYPKANVKTLYRANLTKVANWSGPDIIGAKTINTIGKTNQVFMAVDLSLMVADMPALQGFFSIVLKEFNW